MSYRMLHETGSATAQLTVVPTCRKDNRGDVPMFKLVLNDGRCRPAFLDVEWLEFRGGQLWLPSDPWPVMRYEAGGWTYRGKQWPQLECRAMLYVRLESLAGPPGLRIGPRPSFTLRG